MDEIFKTFEMDVSRFSDEDIEAMMNGKVDPFMNMGVPKELLTGEKMLAKEPILATSWRKTLVSHFLTESITTVKLSAA